MMYLVLCRHHFSSTTHFATYISNLEKNRQNPELKKVGSMGSTLPEHTRFFPGTPKARNYLKDIRIIFQAICSVKIARIIYISLLAQTLSLYYPTIDGIYTVCIKKTQEREITQFCSRNASALFSTLAKP